MFNNKESENKMQKQTFDIGTYFTIQYYARKHQATITRKAQWTEDCYESNHKVKKYSYIKYFDIDANGIRCATSEVMPYKISEVSDVR